MDSGESRRKESFDRVADAYDRYRPSPPTQVVEAIIDLAELSPASTVLEIGAGTGQLSVPLASLGVDLTAIELGQHLAAIARRNLDALPNARVDACRFEDWPLPGFAFDAVIWGLLHDRVTVG